VSQLETEPNDIKWGVRKRLEFLEEELFWAGKVNRISLMEKTGISKAQASADIAQYKLLAGENLIYDLTEKAYLVSPNFRPLFIDTSPNAYLERLSNSTSQVERISFPTREIAPDIFRSVYAAIEKKSFILVQYQSMSSPAPLERIIAPHSIISDGMRWHVRAYDALRKDFRDFLLGRILSISEVSSFDTSGHHWKQDNDDSWNREVVLKIEPHPELSAPQKKVVERDFRMENGVACLNIRHAWVFYVVEQLRLLDDSARPPQQQVVLRNKEEIATLLRQTEGKS